MNATAARGRPPAPVPIASTFHVRTTAGEARAIDELIERFRAERAIGGVPSPGDGKTLWFRTIVHRLAQEAGIKITEDSPAQKSPQKGGKSARKPK